MAFVSFRDEIVGHEFTAIRLRHSLLEILPLLVTQNVDARAASFDFSSSFLEFGHILFRPVSHPLN